MADVKKIKTALVSVFHKDGLDELLAELNKNGVNSFPQEVHKHLLRALAIHVRKSRI